MSEDVESALIDIIATQGKTTPEAAREQLEQMAIDGLYIKDVY